MPLALLLAALAAAPTTPPDVQVTARAAEGRDSAELARAIGRALLATGATVVIGPAGSERCGDGPCAALSVREEGPGRFRVEARRSGHPAATTVVVPEDATVFERARAIAVEARLLIDGPVEAPPRPARKAARPPARRDPAPVLADATPAEPPPAEPLPVASPPPAPPTVAAAPTAPLRIPVTAPVEVTPSPAVPGTPAWARVATIAGAGAGVAAGVFGLLAYDRYDALSDRSASLPDARRRRDQGKAFQTAGLVLGGAAVVGITAGTIGWWHAREVSVGAAPLPEGGAVTVGGSLP